MKLNMITLAVVLLVVVFFALHAHQIAWTATRVAGAVIAGAALVGLTVARLQLGASFSVRAKAKKLVTTGIYAKIRNPIYVFGELWLLGLALLIGRWEVLLLALAIVPVQVVRARKEAKVLEQAFGEEYVQYRARTWF